MLTALALEETNHHNPANVAMTAEKSGDGYKLSGEKKFVIDGHIAGKLIVVARTSGAAGDTQGLSMFLVDADAKGVTITRTHMVDSRNAAIVSLDGVEVSADDALGGIGAAYPELENVLDLGRACIAAEMLGGAEAVFDTTLEYLSLIHI